MKLADITPQEVGQMFDALRAMDPNLTNTPTADLTVAMVITGAWAMYRQIDDERLVAESEVERLQMQAEAR